MPGIISLIEVFEPIAPDALCGAVIDRFLDAPGCDLLVVAEFGRPVGVVARGALRASEADRPIVDLMTRPLTVDADIDLSQACALVLGHTDPTPGVVVVDRSTYAGVVSTRNQLRHWRGAAAEVAGSQRFLDQQRGDHRRPAAAPVAVRRRPGLRAHHPGIEPRHPAGPG